MCSDGTSPLPALVQQTPVGQGLFIIEPIRLLPHALYSVGLLWTGDQRETETST